MQLDHEKKKIWNKNFRRDSGHKSRRQNPKNQLFKKKNWWWHVSFLSAVCVSIVLSFYFFNTNIDPNFTQWMREQIQEDFFPFCISGITEEMNNETMRWSKKFYEEKESLCVRVKVINSEIYQFNNRGKRVDFPAISFVLNEIKKKYPLPDLDFVYFYAAGPEPIAQDGSIPTGPLLAGNKTNDFPNLILYHDRLTLVAKHRAYSWLKTIKKTEHAIKKNPWESKVEKLFWRGQISDCKIKDCKNWYDHSIRGQLYLLSKRYPDLLDVALTALTMLDRNHIQHEPNIEMVPFTNIATHNAYKYQIVLDGYTCSNPGYAWRLLSNCLVFKVNSKKRQWFYKGLKPWVHYIPIRENLSDLITNILYAKEHDQQMRTIAFNGRKFAQDYLKNINTQINYYYQVLLKYASLQQFSPHLREYEKVQTNKNDPYKNLKVILPFYSRSSLHNDNHQELNNLIHKYDIKTVVELGSCLGESTQLIASNLPEGGIVYAIDEWTEWYQHKESDASIPPLYEQFLSNIIHAHLEEKIIPMRMISNEAAKDLVVVKPDLIYINAFRDEESIYKDLCISSHLIEEKGIICGNGWSWEENGHYPVQKAVKRFAQEHNLDIESEPERFFWFMTTSPP